MHEPVEPDEALAPATFSFVLHRSLAGLAKPGTAHPIEADLAFLEREGFDLIVSLTVDPLPSALVKEFAMASLHLPVVDFTAPRMEQLSDFVAAADEVIKSGGAVAVHCGAGLGRTGTFLAAYFVAHGMPPNEAIETIRALRPGSIETRSQEEAVVEFSKIADHTRI